MHARLALPEDPPAVRLDSTQLCAYDCVFALTPDVSATVRCRDGELVAERMGRPAAIYRPETADVFFSPGQPRTRRIFQRDSSGAVTGFVDRREGHDIVWHKVRPHDSHGELVLSGTAPPLPERVIAAAGDVYVNHILDQWLGTAGSLDPLAREADVTAFRDPVVVHAACEDYRAGSTTRDDRVDRCHTSGYGGTSMSLNTGAAELARLWRGATRAEDADAYLAYLHETGIPEYRRTPGNCGVFVLRRIVDGRAEFHLITFWESEEAIRRFAGEDIGKAVFYPEDDRFLIARDERVDHFEVLLAVRPT